MIEDLQMVDHLINIMSIQELCIKILLKDNSISKTAFRTIQFKIHLSFAINFRGCHVRLFHLY